MLESIEEIYTEANFSVQISLSNGYFKSKLDGKVCTEPIKSTVGKYFKFI